MGWSAFLWTNLWWIIGLPIVLVLGAVAFFTIRHFVKKHKAKQATAGKHENVKVKDSEQAQTVESREATQKTTKVEQNVSANKNVDKTSKFALPRFDFKDAEIVEKDLQRFKRHQELSLKNARTEQENNELLKLNEHFSKTYNHIPNQSIPADYTQKGSGCYCFNGKGSKNFKEYCEQHPYDATKDNGDRIIVQIDIGSKFKKLSFCINPNDSAMVNAAMQDIDSKVSNLNANPTVSTISVHNGTFKVNFPITYDKFCHKNKEPEQSASF